MTEDRVRKALRHLRWDTGVTVPPQHLGRGQCLWLRSNSALLRFAQSEGTHHSVTRGEMQGGAVRLKPSLGTSPAAAEEPCFGLLHRGGRKKRWRWAHSCPSAKQLVVGLQVWWWDVVALVPACPPSPENTRATKLWEKHRAGEGTRGHTGGRMTST